MSRQRFALLGFTLIEAVIAIAITGIIAAIVAVFIRIPVEGYVDSVRRAELTDAADTALRRVARDVRSALPNSLRQISGAGSERCFELLPLTGGGRYRAANGAGPTNILDFSIADTSFDVIAGSGLPSFAGATYHVVIYNLGIPGADAYDATPAGNSNRARIAGTATATRIVLASANKFPFESPGRRFQVIPDNSVVYSCSGSSLLRSTRAISATALATCPSTGSVLVDNVDCSNTSFTYTPAVSARNGLLTMTLVLTQAGESVRLYQEVHVNNAP